MEETSIIVRGMTNDHIKYLINRWDSRAKLANEIGANVAAVHKWAAKNRIPTKWQEAVVSAAQANGFTEIDAAWMLRFHAKNFAKNANFTAPLEEADG